MSIIEAYRPLYMYILYYIYIYNFPNSLYEYIGLTTHHLNLLPPPLSLRPTAFKFNSVNTNPLASVGIRTVGERMFTQVSAAIIVRSTFTKRSLNGRAERRASATQLT